MQQYNVKKLLKIMQNIKTYNPLHLSTSLHFTSLHNVVPRTASFAHHTCGTLLGLCAGVAALVLKVAHDACDCVSYGLPPTPPPPPPRDNGTDADDRPDGMALVPASRDAPERYVLYC